jgi:hypothetical protein
MSGLFSALAAKILVSIVTALFAALPKFSECGVEETRPGRATIIITSSDTTSDTTAAEDKSASREAAQERAKAEDARRQAAEERKKVVVDRERAKRESVKISISDRGIKVSESGDSIIVDFDMDELGDVIDQLEDLEDLESLPSIIIGDDEERRFVEVKGKDIVRVGESVYIDRNELVRGDLVSIFGNVVIEGKVMGDVVSIFGDIDLESSAIINGEVVTVLGELSRSEGARVRGEIVEVGGSGPNITPVFWGIPPFTRGLGGFVALFVKFIIGLLLLGIVLAFLPDRMKRSSEYVFGSFFKSLGIGAVVIIAGSIVVAVIAAILSITIVGIPVAILLILSFAALCLLGYFVSAVSVGQLIVRKMKIESDSIYLQGFIGLFALAILSILAGFMWFQPFLHGLRMMLKSLGGFVTLLALLVGVGAFITSKAGALQQEKKPDMLE